MEWKHGSVVVSDDKERLQIDVVHGFLREVYWAKGIPLDVVQRSIEHSLCFGAYEDGAQIGFSRVITDRATFAYLCDVFVLAEHRGKGASRAMMQAIMDHPDLANLRRWMLITDDAHGLYRKFGFQVVPAPHRHMEISDPRIYETLNSRRPKS